MFHVPVQSQRRGRGLSPDSGGEKTKTGQVFLLGAVPGSQIRWSFPLITVDEQTGWSGVNPPPPIAGVKPPPRWREAHDLQVLTLCVGLDFTHILRECAVSARTR